MNLYLFTDNDSAAMYGIGTYLNELTHALDGSAIHIHIVHLHSHRPEFEIVKVNRVNHWYIPEVRNQNTFSGLVTKVEEYCRNVIYLLKLHINDTGDLVFHFNFNQYCLLAKGLKMLFNCKTVTTIHFMKWALELQGNISRIHSIEKRPENERSDYEQILYKTDEYESLLYRESDRVIALSQYAQSLLYERYRINPDRITFIPNGLEDINPMSEFDRIALRRKWGLSLTETLIVFSGRICEVKGLIYLIKAFRRVVEKKSDCRLMIAGNGEFDRHMKECDGIWTNVTWTGLLDKDKLYELYSIADIGVLPSFHEQCSYVAIEMMRHALPIIGSTSTGLKEMIVDGETGLHVPVIEHSDRTEFDSELLSEKILFLMENPEERLFMGYNARKRYGNTYSIDIFRENMQKFYHSLLKSKNN